MEILLLIRSKSDGNLREVRRELGDGLVVGRGAEDGVLLDGNDLSREHLVFTGNESNVYVTDLSVNGTWLNGNRLRKSIKSRVRAEDSIELPGYVLSFRPADQPQPTGEAAAPQLPAPYPVDSQIAIPAEDISKPPGMLAPVLQFVGSFTFMEKVLLVVGVSGLLFLYTYIGS
jgi:pSer/pThr/pTyr-binding forkhead associated (FHA) protein